MKKWTIDEKIKRGIEESIERHRKKYEKHVEEIKNLEIIEKKQKNYLDIEEAKASKEALFVYELQKILIGWGGEKQ